MRILYVVNNFFAKGNGLSASARRTVGYLREAGLDVRVISAAGGDPDARPDYLLPDWKVPVFDKLIHKHGYSFAATDRSVMEQAVDWADIVHLEEPFIMEMAMVKMVRKAGKILTSTYHLHPENLFSSVHMRRSIILNWGMMALWKHSVFNKCRVIQSPTDNAAARLARWRFKPEVRVISNGMLPHEDIDGNSPVCASDRGDGTFTIVTTGRYSVEKDQITLLRAMKYSKYAGRIRLVIAGRGPIGNTLRRKAGRLLRKGILKYEPDFGFHTLDELEDIYRRSDLYIHCAVIEVEGLSCMEAIELGMVPIIATGRLTATSQYALSDMSKFRQRNARELAQRIDWWLEHDDERMAEARRYLGMGRDYDIRKSIDQLVRMYTEVYEEAHKD